MKGLPRTWRFIGLGFLGATVGAAGFVAKVGNAASYLSDDPKACINCHIMNPEFATWEHSSHGRVTNCNDCHVPHTSTAAKYFYKGKDGMRHSLIFTLRGEPQVIAATQESRKVIQENCLRCHASVVSETNTAAHAQDRSCIDCHREVPHGRVHSLSSTPNAAIPLDVAASDPWMASSLKPKP